MIKFFPISRKDIMYKDIHREITQLAPEDSFLVFDRIKDDFDFPIHFHPEYELNFIRNGEGVRRVAGDSLEEIREIELVLVGPNLVHGWELHNCKNKEIHEITIHFHNDLFDKKCYPDASLNLLKICSIDLPTEYSFLKRSHTK